MKNKYIILGSLIFAVLLTSIGCKKAVEQIKQDALIDAMVASTWYVGQYLDGGNAFTSEFVGYDFNFKNDYTVIATKPGSSVTGKWTADLSTKILTANFTTGLPFSRLNGTWAIYYQDSEGPKMNQFVGGVELKLALKKR